MQAFVCVGVGNFSARGLLSVVYYINASSVRIGLALLPRSCWPAVVCHTSMDPHQLFICSLEIRNFKSVNEVMLTIFKKGRMIAICGPNGAGMYTAVQSGRAKR